MAQKPFRYSLEALLRKRQFDWKAVKLEETTAERAVSHGAVRVEEARGTIEQAEELLREARRDGTPIDATRQELLLNYLGQQRLELQERQQRLQRSRDVHTQIQSNLDGIGRGIKSLEKHRAGRQAEHALTQYGIEQRGVDELWLLRVGAKPEKK